MSINKVFLEGRLGQDPEIRTTNNGNIMATFNLAVDRRPNKDKEKTTDWFNCIAFGKRAELIEKYLSKGSKVVLFGRFENNPYERRDGVTVPFYQLIIEEIDLLFIDKNNDNTQTKPVNSNTNDNETEDTFPLGDDDDKPW